MPLKIWRERLTKKLGGRGYACYRYACYHRRSFLKISGAVLATSGIGISMKPVAAYAKPLKVKYAKKTTTLCPYCSIGCGIIVSTAEGKAINTEGDPKSPINAGAL